MVLNLNIWREGMLMAKKPVTTGQRVQLHRACSKLGLGSRTQAMAWIRAGLIRVDGRIVREPLTWVDLDRQRITRDGENSQEDGILETSSANRKVQRTRNDESRLVIALHKPVDVVTTRRDERGRRTVYDLLPPGLPWVFPAGRLDADSEGLLILTNDSQLAVRLTEPAAHVPKTYQVTIRGVPSGETLDQLRGGIRLADGPTRPVQIRVIHPGKQFTVVEMKLTEGRNRQIRRMWHAVGHRVKKLVRVGIGEFQLGDLSPGACRRLSTKEVRHLVSGFAIKR
jgi:23S rRNA pseudouridine2605 synthase